MKSKKETASKKKKVVKAAVKVKKVEVKKKAKATPAVEKKVIVEAKAKALPEKESAPKAAIVKPPKEMQPAAQTQTGNKTYLTIDFPIEDEKVQGLCYTIRIGSSNEGRVQISFNDAQWNPCRFNSGYWWFDWGYFVRGDYRIVARMVNDKGEVIITSKERRCKVW